MRGCEPRLAAIDLLRPRPATSTRPLPRSALREIAISLALANLLYLRVWNQLLVGRWQPYFVRAPPTPQAYLFVFLGLLALSAFLFVIARLVSTAGSGPLAVAGRVVIIAATLVATNGLRSLVPQGEAAANVVATVAFYLLACGVFALVLQRGMASVSRSVHSLLLALTPFAALTLGNLTWAGTEGLRDPTANYAEPTPLAFQSRKADAQPRTRVVILLFDEMDETAAFEAPPFGLDLRELNRFRASSVWSDDAYAPNPWTIRSIPSYLSGRQVAQSRARSTSLELMYEGDWTWRDWGGEDSLFTRARALGSNAALVGWYHSYCRVLGQQLSECAWYPSSPPPVPLDAAASLRWQAASVLGSIPGAHRLALLERLGIGPSVATEAARAWHASIYRGVLRDTTRFATDARLDLVFAHIPVPHPPYLSAPTPADRASGITPYHEALRLADRALGEIRRAMEHGGLWDGSTVIITSDHWWRHIGPGEENMTQRDVGGAIVGRRERRVPFMVKLPRQTTSVRVEGTLETLVLHDLVLASLGGQVNGPDDTAAWLRGRVRRDDQVIH